jgi:hypothetical protein
MILAMVPPKGVASKPIFELKLIGVTAGAIAIGLVLYVWQRLSRVMRATIGFGSLGFVLCIFWHLVLTTFFVTGHPSWGRTLGGIASISCPAYFLRLSPIWTALANGLLYAAVAALIARGRQKRLAADLR